MTEPWETWGRGLAGEWGASRSSRYLGEDRAAGAGAGGAGAGGIGPAEKPVGGGGGGGSTARQESSVARLLREGQTGPAHRSPKERRVVLRACDPRKTEPLLPPSSSRGAQPGCPSLGSVGAPPSEGQCPPSATGAGILHRGRLSRHRAGLGGGDGGEGAGGGLAGEEAAPRTSGRLCACVLRVDR